MYTDYGLSITKPMLCVGSMSVDIVEQCNSMPADKRDHLSVDARWQRGGHASNVSYVLRLLGAQVEFLGVLSRSSMLREILQEMERINIDLSNCPRTDKNPAFTTVVIDRKTGCRSILECSRKFPYIGIEEFKKLDLNRYGWVHFEARNKLDIIPMMRAIHNYNSGRTDHIKISLKVDGCFNENKDLFDMCHYLIFSRQLALDLGWQSVRETCIELDKTLPLPRSILMRRPSIICSWGPYGAGCLDAHGQYFDLPLPAGRKPIDTYGVGECFTAGVIYALYLRQMPLAAAVTFGNRVAVFKTTRSGYNHIAQFQHYPVTISNDDKSSELYSEGDESDDFTCPQ
ncbi:ketohexokinase-like [Drosophila hydei]|uniref:Ketohexokinase-like n=1 Tax=Drosophila hydei TaxID=7224 RepID=A0A6J1LE37_DROHY|nr:ketohexokinase-like [Drosophila hydei]